MRTRRPVRSERFCAGFEEEWTVAVVKMTGQEHEVSELGNSKACSLGIFWIPCLGDRMIFP